MTRFEVRYNNDIKLTQIRRFLVHYNNKEVRQNIMGQLMRT